MALPKPNIPRFLSEASLEFCPACCTSGSCSLREALSSALEATLLNETRSASSMGFVKAGIPVSIFMKSAWSPWPGWKYSMWTSRLSSGICWAILTANSIIIVTPPSRSGGAGSMRCICKEPMSFSLSVAVNASRLAADDWPRKCSVRPSKVANRQLTHLATKASSSSLDWHAGEYFRMLSWIVFNCVDKPVSRSGWKYLSKMFSTSHEEMNARPTAVISCFPVSTAFLLTTACRNLGICFHSLRILNDSWAINPSNLLNLVAYSLSSQDVRDTDKRWCARVF